MCIINVMVIIMFFSFCVYGVSLILLVSDSELIDIHDCKSSSNEGKGFSSGKQRMEGGLS